MYNVCKKKLNVFTEEIDKIALSSDKRMKECKQLIR